MKLETKFRLYQVLVALWIALGIWIGGALDKRDQDLNEKNQHALLGIIPTHADLAIDPDAESAGPDSEVAYATR